MAIISAAVLASTAVVPAKARDAAVVIDIPAGPLAASLNHFSKQTDMSVGFAGVMPRGNVARVRGRMTPETALAAILRGTGLRAVRVGNVFRLERAPPAARRRPPLPLTPIITPRPAPEVTIFVTAQKREQNLSAVPFSLSIIEPDAIAGGSPSPSSRDIALATEGLAMTNLGPGRNRLFIRGVADSPFNGKSQSTVAVQIDEARVTFDAPNPDLRLIDIDRVEILKGPQGPLYGSGALGGIYHLVTQRPELDRSSGWARTSVQGVDHGGIGLGLEAMANVPLVADRLALRGVVYRVVEPGWIDNSDGRTNSNSTRTSGLRLATRWSLSTDWTIDAGMAWQDIDARDSQYVLTSERNLMRDSRIPEPTDNDLMMAHATVSGQLGGMRLLSATSVVNQEFDYVVDATEAAASFGLTGTTRFQDNRAYSVFNQEFRLTPAGSARWLVGLSYMRANTMGRSAVSAEPDQLQIVETLDRRTTEIALFGELTQRIFGLVDATVGGRVFRSVSRDFTTEQTQLRSLERTRMLFSPSASLSMPLDGRGIVYLRYARAKRPGGLAPADADMTGEFESDKVNSFELGLRQSNWSGDLALSASIYHTRWDRVQSDYLLPTGLISTRNAGRAAVSGVDVAAEWQIDDDLGISIGGAWQRARLVSTPDGLRAAQRLPVVPDLTGRILVERAIAVSGWEGTAAIQGHYFGRAVLSLDPDLNRRMGDYANVGASANLSRGRWTMTAQLDNVLDIQADSFAFGNPFSIRSSPQFTPLRPRTLTLSVTRRW